MEQINSASYIGTIRTEEMNETLKDYPYTGYI